MGNLKNCKLVYDIIKYTASIQAKMNFRFPHKRDLIEKEQPWILQLKQRLIEKNHQFLIEHPKRQLVFQTNVWSNLAQHNSLMETHSYTLCSTPQGHYSQYVPITRNQSPICQLSECFLYLRYLKEKKSTQHEIEVFKISTDIHDSNCFGKWQQLCRAYVPPMPIEDMFNYYHLLLAMGTGKLKAIRQLKFPKCRQEVILMKVLEVKRFMERSDGINSMITVSLEKGQQVTLENLSKTMKNLFCPICLVYDCMRHLIPVNVVDNNFQYVRAQNTRYHLERKKKTAVALLHKFISLIHGGEDSFDLGCSQFCFRRLSAQRWNFICSLQEGELFSPIFASIVRMGVEMYNYSPCLIKDLLHNTLIIQRGGKNSPKLVPCEIIFCYFIRDFNLLSKMQHKFYESENSQLENEVKNYLVQTITQEKRVNRRKNCRKAKKIANYENDEYNSVCFHFFLDQEPTDLQCLYCDCQKRGYCLPQCLCSQQCQIPLKGCRCKGDNNCFDNKCSCFKSNRVCTQSTCQNCCSSNKNNWCQNNEFTYSSNKLTRVGLSTIAKAGLGLFAGEFIAKGSFIIKYLGELVESESLQKFRENLVRDNLFYTFKLKQYQSIDSRMYGNKARFINHSHNKQNISPMTIRIQQEDVIIFYALRDIHEHQELLFNYNGQGSLSQFRDKYPFID